MYGVGLLVLAVWKARELWKGRGVTGSRLIVVLVVDQVVYFFSCVSVSCLEFR